MTARELLEVLEENNHGTSVSLISHAGTLDETLITFDIDGYLSVAESVLNKPVDSVAMVTTPSSKDIALSVYLLEE